MPREILDERRSKQQRVASRSASPDDVRDDADDRMQIDDGSVRSATGVNVDEGGAADDTGRGLVAEAEDGGRNDVDNSDLDFDDDGSFESGLSTDEDDDSLLLQPECPELPEQVNRESDGENAEGRVAFIDQIDEEGPEVVLQADAGYEEDGTKNDNYKHWRGVQYNEDTGKFRWDPEGNVDEVPKASEWTRVPPSKMKEIKVTFNGGREVLLDQYVEEHNAFLARLVELNIPQTKEGLFHKLFGERSRFAQAMTRTLDITYEEFSRFIATVGFSAEFNQPAERLEKDSRINFTGYMEASKCNEIWRKIAIAGKDGTGDKLWAELEDALNRDCRELFLTGKDRVVHLRIALDDDKVHFHFSLDALRKDREFLVGMKGCQHVKANCRGFTIHSAVSATTGHPLGFSVERSGDTSTDIYERMVRVMFHHAFTNGGAIHEALRGIVFCSDRGYWNPVVIIFLLGFAATVFGTWRRMPSNPITYNQTTKLGGRWVIDTRFGRSVFNAFAVWKDTMLKAVAWRSGTGKVSIAATSDVSSALTNEVQKLDFTFKSDADFKWYRGSMSQQERDLKAFPTVIGIGKLEDESKWNLVKRHLLLLPVKMLTVSDLDTIWFELRKFALTSSTVDYTLRAVAPAIVPSDPIYSSFLAVLTYGGMTGSLRGGTNDDQDEVDGSDSESESDGNDTDNDLMSAGKIKEVLQLLRGRVDGTTLDACIVDIGRMNQACNGTSSSKLTSMLMALGHDRSKADIDKPKQIALFKKWTKTVNKTSAHIKLLPPPSARDDDDASESSSSSPEFYEYSFPYDTLSAKDLQTQLAMRMGGQRFVSSGSVPGPHAKPGNKSERAAALLYLDQHPDEVPRHKEEDDEGPPLTDLSCAIITGVIKRAFLKPHKDVADKSATRFGHQNEMPYLKQYYEDSKSGAVPDIELCHVRNCGLAMQEEREYVRGSADAIVFEEVGDSVDSHPVECKCRSGAGFRGSVTRAIQIQKQIVELGGREQHRRLIRGKAVYARIRSSDTEKMRELIPDPHEALQLLHHCAVYGKDKAALLVGKSDGVLLYGVVVDFDDQLLENYSRILEYLYENGLQQFYQDDISKLPVKLIEEIILGDDKLKQKYQMEDFYTSFLTCRALIPSKSKAKFPIPPCDKGIPFEHSLWNGSKGGSDTATRFTYNCQVVLPIRTPQTTVSARLMMLYFVLYHRGCQSVTGRKEPDAETDTLESIRNRNNKRIPFHSTLQYLCTLLLLNAKGTPSEELSEEEGESGPLVAAAPRETRRNKRSRHEIDDRIMEATGRTGATPHGRGMPIHPKNPSATFELFQRRARKCPGRPMKVGRLVASKEIGQDGEIKFVRRTCAFCGATHCSYECSGCHQSLCFDTDRTEQIRKVLKNKKAESLAKAPGLSDLPAGSAPAKWCRAGETKAGSGEYKYVMKSCFHHCHPNYFTDLNLKLGSDDEASSNDGDEEEEDWVDEIWQGVCQHPSSSPNVAS